MSDTLSALRPLRRESLVDEAANVLSDAIIEGRLPAGRSVSEEFISRRLSVSRPTARSAIAQLVHIRLLDQERNRAAEVPVISADELAGLHYIRSVMEVVPIEEIVEEGKGREAIQSGTSPLHFSLADIEAAASPTPRQLIDHEMGFHAALASVAANDSFDMVYEHYASRLHLGLIQHQVQLDPTELVAHHRTIVHALALGQLSNLATRATLEMQAHLEWVAKS